MAESAAITPLQAAAVLGDLRQARDAVNTRAAGLSLMIWGLVVTSTAGSLVVLNFVALSDDADLGNIAWSLFLAANVVTVAAWAAFGAALQNAVWLAFGVRRKPGVAAWKAPATAFGTAFLLVALNLPLQGLTRALQGLGEDATQAEIHWNLGFAFAFSIAGAIVVAVTILLGERGFPRRPGVALGLSMMVVGHLTTFLWFPDLGVAGPLLAVALLPLMFIGLGAHLFRQG